MILSLFGTTTGLEVLNLPLSNAAQPVQLEDSWIEVSPSHLIIKPGKESYMVLRRFVGTQTMTWVGLYRAAKEIGYERQGSFYGAGVWLIDRVVDTKLAIEVLRLMADQIQVKAMNGERFVKRLADVRGDISMPNQMAALSDNPVKVSSGCHPSGETAFIAGGTNPLEVIDWAQRAASAQFLARIFIGAPDQSPDTSGRTTTPGFRSLANAIDHTFNRKTADLQKKLSELDLKVKDLDKQCANFKDEYSNVKLLLEGERRESIATKQQLHDTNASYRREYARAEALQSHINSLQSSNHTSVVPQQNPPVEGQPVPGAQVQSGAPGQSGATHGRASVQAPQNTKRSEPDSAKRRSSFELIDMLLAFFSGICLAALISFLLFPKQPENSSPRQDATTIAPVVTPVAPIAPSTADTVSEDGKTPAASPESTLPYKEQQDTKSKFDQKNDQHKNKNKDK